MKRVLGIVLVLLLTAGAAGCGSSQTSSIYTAGGSWDLGEKIATATTAQSSYLPENGSHVQRTIAHDTLPVKFIIDADVQIQCDKMPSAKVEPHRFTQHEVDTIIEFLVGDAYFAAVEYDYYDDRKHEEVHRYNKPIPIDELPKASRTFGATKDKYIADWYEIYPEGYYEEAYEEAYIVDEIDGSFEKDGALNRLVIFSDDTGKWSKMEYSRPYQPFVTLNFPMKPETSACVTTYKDALKIAEDTVKGIGAYQQGMRLADASIDKNADGSFSGCDFVFAREVNGAQCSVCNYISYSETYIRSDIRGRYGDSKASWGYESLEIKVDKYGLTYIKWQYPYQITVILTDNTSMLSFEKIMDCFSKTVVLKYSDFENMHEWEYITEINREPKDGEYTGNPSNDIIGIWEEPGAIDSEADYIEGHISKISLGLMRVQSGEEYFLIPVWDFYGDITRIKKDKNETIEMKFVQDSSILMTVNAIDGSVIDRRYGY